MISLHVGPQVWQPERSTGTVSAVNTNLEQHPDLVNQDPYGDGWFVKVKMKDRKEFDALMDRAAYQSMIGK